ncbi:hypothetical protein AGMMS50212_09920 [Spirochaetia bacterium]|nr:hypothetical protein AGMMS50212_09920 [Spirochaetia bacterium]
MSMQNVVHNIVEDIVIDEVEKACAAIENQKDKQGICTCVQCRLDAACFVLNRVEPRYIVSSRGFIREDHFTLEKQQMIADLTVLVYQALKQVGHNKRPDFDHTKKESSEHKLSAFFNFPTIIGRLFNGQNFYPMSGIDVTLFLDGKPAEIKDPNWQNPCKLISKSEGTYTFWPKSIPAKKAGEKRSFVFSVKSAAENFSPLSHVFEIPMISEAEEKEVFSLDRTYKIADLYMFAPDEERDLNRYISPEL